MRPLLLAILFALGTAALAEEPLRETEAQTIARCLQELRSNDPEVRRRAALVIGKYVTPETQDALIRCLGDADARIRQSALVSLCEEHRVPTEAREAVLSLLKDPEVQIRRLAASLLPELVLFGPVIRPGIAGRTMEPALVAAVNHALGDEDASVRKSALRVATYFPEMLDASRLEPFFTSEDVELKTLALQSYAMQRVNAKDALKKVVPLVEDPSAEVRTALARVLNMLGTATIPQLYKLSKDEEATVVSEALKGLLRMDRQMGTRLLLERLSSPDTPLSIKQALLPLLHNSSHASPDLLQGFLQDGPDALRLPAYRELITGRYGKMEMDFYLGCLANPDPMVRQLASNTVTSRLPNLSLPQFTKLASNPNPDIRELAVKLVRRVPASLQRNELLLDLCADDATDVRVAALKQLALLRPQGWLDILTATFEDDNPRIREAAAEALCFAPRTPETLRLLNEYLPHCTNPVLALRIQKILSPPTRPVRRRP